LNNLEAFDILFTTKCFQNIFVLFLIIFLNPQKNTILAKEHKNHSLNYENIGYMLSCWAHQQQFINDRLAKHLSTSYYTGLLYENID